jgi:hypothetical protein
MAYQLDLPAEGEGLVVAMKRPASSYALAVFPLRALQPDSTYEFQDLDRGNTGRLAGRALCAGGLEVRLERKPDTALIRYRRVS